MWGSMSATHNAAQQVETVAQLDQAAVVNVATGRTHCALVTKKGEIYMMGNND